MGRRFAELAFTPLVKHHQQLHGSRHLYERVERSNDLGVRLGPDEQAFITGLDGFYMATVSETGWPYIQFRGGPKAFLHALDPQTIAFADLRGNKQYISRGNLEHDNRVALFLMDYPAQSRLKILGRAEILEGTSEAEATLETLLVPGEKTLAERAIIIHVEAFDWNCPQHITPRYSQEELSNILDPMRKRIDLLEAENKRLRGSPEPPAATRHSSTPKS
jgi:predicted pyridoxine 5'-phosphate oxidase superfamily flavin-nucleotide-binding protein